VVGVAEARIWSGGTSLPLRSDDASASGDLRTRRGKANTRVHATATSSTAAQACARVQLRSGGLARRAPGRGFRPNAALGRVGSCHVSPPRPLRHKASRHPARSPRHPQPRPRTAPSAARPCARTTRIRSADEQLGALKSPRRGPRIAQDGLTHAQPSVGDPRKRSLSALSALLSLGIVDSPTRGCPMRPGGTNLRILGDLRRSPQTP